MTSGPVITSKELPSSLPRLLDKSIIGRIHPFAQESIIVHVSIVEVRAIASLDSWQCKSQTFMACFYAQHHFTLLIHHFDPTKVSLIQRQEEIPKGYYVRLIKNNQLTVRAGTGTDVQLYTRELAVAVNIMDDGFYGHNISELSIFLPRHRDKGLVEHVNCQFPSPSDCIYSITKQTR